MTPDDLLAGAMPDGQVIVYDDDQYYMAGVLADKLLRAGRRVTFVTPGLEVSTWTAMTDEQMRVQTGLMAAGATIHLARRIEAWDGVTARFASIYDGSPLKVSGDALLVVAARQAADSLAEDMRALQAAGGLPQIETIRAIGDCRVPGAIYSAVYDGHRVAREFGAAVDPDAVGYSREIVAVD